MPMMVISITIWVQLLSVACLWYAFCAYGDNNLNLTLKTNEVIEFTAKNILRVGIYNPHFWIENNERSTSKDYTLWKEADVHLIEWPGNITVFDPSWPLLKWTKQRSKYLENRCCQHYIGIEMRAFAYRYLYLTWGPYRLTRTFSPPLTVPGHLLSTKTDNKDKYKNKNKRVEIPITDIAFVHDALLITTLEDGEIILVSGLEMAYARLTQTGMFPLKYSIAKGITSPVNKLVTQYCCVKSKVCPFGETVIAYREYSSDFGIFVSSDGGMNFKKLRPQMPVTSSLLHSVLSYPDTGKVLVLHGNETMATLDSYSMSTGALVSAGKSAQGKIQLNGIRGMLQGVRIGEEMSVIIWDQCNVWYSPAEDNEVEEIEVASCNTKRRNLTKAVFYIHGSIYKPGSKGIKHYIVSRHCKFGTDSSFAIGKTGKLALLDSNNVFFLGVDMKSTMFQLVAMKVDMSLIRSKHSLSIAPHFDHSQDPKLQYPPRFLEVPDKRMLGKNYGKRLGMRLLPKTVFPTEFISVFYEENARLPKKFKNFALRPCQTSSISVNRSITQKPKVYTFSPLSHVNFTVVFKSGINASRQLNYEPSEVTKFLQLRMRLLSRIRTEPNNPQYWFTYEVIIKSRSLSMKRRNFLINFFTQKDLRCNIQSSNPVYIKIDDNPEITPNMIEHDMSQTTYLKTDSTEKGEYGKTVKTSTCSSCSQCDSGVGEDEVLKAAQIAAAMQGIHPGPHAAFGKIPT